MKPYFAKYLPVEGEIHSGGKYWNRQHNCADDIGDEVHVALLRIGTFKSAKLFLCSRDIQVGDKMRWQLTTKSSWKDVEVMEILDMSSYGVPLTVIIKDGDVLVHTDPTFKVIGEISPDALFYVKEGDEFDEDDITEPMPKDVGSNKAYCYIKGPCGHFH